MNFAHTLKQLLIVMRFHKPIGILLLLWPTVWALWLSAHGMPQLHILMIFIVGVIIMRAAGCIINDYADRHIDKHVNRTHARPLTTGQLSSKIALLTFVILLIIALGLASLLNFLCVLLAIPAALLAISYPFCKRFFHAPQFILGLAFAWSIPMAYAANLNSLPWQSWIVFLSTVLWVIAYDTQYALCDLTDDLRIGIKSTAIYFGKYCLPIIISLQLLFLITLCVVGFLYHLNVGFYFSLLIVLLLFLYQTTLVKVRLPADCLKAFTNNHWVGLVIFCGLALGLY